MAILINILVGALVAFIVRLIIAALLPAIGIPAEPWAMIVALIVFLMFLFGDHLGIRYPWRG
jgi:sterol desaturase/sphingolipid hydroxylase (fatty acid hydroxylase superfamily)